MAKADILAQLQRDILPLQGYKSSLQNTGLDAGLGPIRQAFPSSTFPLAAVHEFFATKFEEVTASSGFIAGILSSLMQNTGTVVWLSIKQTVFPPALKRFGIDPDRLIFINLKKDKDLLWATEEALKCSSLSAVVGEITDLSFTDSRRFQLAVEQSGVTGFLLRLNPRNLATACISRWRIRSLGSGTAHGLPGIAHPRWKVELLKVRNGRPGAWELEWKAGKFSPIYKTVSILREQQRKTG